MLTFVFLIFVLNTIVLVGAIILAVLRDDRASKEISRKGNDFLARWRM
jgi:hypothetical protein